MAFVFISVCEPVGAVILLCCLLAKPGISSPGCKSCNSSQGSRDQAAQGTRSRFAGVFHGAVPCLNKEDEAYEDYVPVKKRKACWTRRSVHGAFLVDVRL